jgi:exodeoxyribonuclease-3
MRLLESLKLEKVKGKNIILTGDFNIAHKEIDLARPHQNMDNIMFTDIERKQIDLVIDLGYSDSFRLFNSKPGNYTWWSYAFDARKRNIGWRIDYIFVSGNIGNKVKSVEIYSNVNISINVFAV